MAEENFLNTMYSISEETSAEEVRAIYDRWAERYDVNLVEENGYVMPERAASALDAAVQDRSCRVLDIGCGTGLSGLAASARGFKNLDGCDLSSGMLERAARTGIYARLFEANLLQPPIDCPNEHYDVALACGVMAVGHLTPDVVHEIMRPVKPEGTLVITVNDAYEHDGKLGKKLRTLDDAGVLTLESAEHGEHIRERNVGGWVFVATRH